MFDASDLTDLYDELGIEASYTSPAGTTSPLRVIFSELGQSVLGDQVVTTEPSVRFMRSEAEVLRGGIFVVNGKSWRVRQAPQALTDGLELLAVLEVMK